MATKKNESFTFLLMPEEILTMRRAAELSRHLDLTGKITHTSPMAGHRFDIQPVPIAKVDYQVTAHRQTTYLRITTTNESNTSPAGQHLWMRRSNALQNLVHTYLKWSEHFLIYVAGSDPERQADNVKGVTPIHFGEDFVLCRRTAREGKNFDVSLHFLLDGEPQTKWYTDAAARQLDDLAAGDHASMIRKIVGNAIDLDPPHREAPRFR